MLSNLIEILRCPFCSGRMEVMCGNDIDAADFFGIIKCYCCEYPVISGIPVLKYRSDIQGKRKIESIISLVKEGRYQESLLSMLETIPPARKNIKLGKRLIRRILPGDKIKSDRERADAKLLELIDEDNKKNISALDWIFFNFVESGMNRTEAYNYFAYRYGQPRHLVALSLLSIIDRSDIPVLELACGFGHITHNILHDLSSNVLSLDREFLPVYVAKKYIAPNARFICFDANNSLPFPDGLFSVVICVDGIHYFLNKAGLMRESKRVTDENAIYLFGSSRNGLLEYPYAGVPLSPDGYKNLVADMPHYLVSDNDLLDDYLKKSKPNLSGKVPRRSLDDQPLISIIASKTSEPFRDYGALFTWPHSQGKLAINPLYQEQNAGSENAVFIRKFPSEFYTQDNIELQSYLPEEVQLNRTVIRDIDNGNRTEEIEKLVDKYFLLGFPDRYLGGR